MLGVKKFFFYVLGIVFIAVLILAWTVFTQPGFDPAAKWILCLMDLVPLICMLYMRHTTKCPHCQKVWVGKRLSNEDLGACSGVFSKKSGDTYHQYEKHRHLLSYQCISCGHEWQKTVERDHQLD